jgi:hypothetical protein
MEIFNKITVFNETELKYILDTSIRYNTNLLHKEQTTEWYDFCCENSCKFYEYLKESNDYCNYQIKMVGNSYLPLDMEIMRFIGRFSKKNSMIYRAYKEMEDDKVTRRYWKTQKYTLIMETLLIEKSYQKFPVHENEVNNILLEIKESIKSGLIDYIKPIKDVWEVGRWSPMIELGNSHDNIKFIKLTIKNPENGIRIFDYLDNQINK